MVPGFNSFELFSDNVFLVTSIITLSLIGIGWYLWGDERLVSLALCCAYSEYFLGLWVRVPGFSFATSVTTSYSVLTTHHLNPVLLQATTPTHILISAFLTTVGGSSLEQVLTWMNLLMPLGITLFSFFIIEKFLHSARLTSLAVMISVIADSQLSKAPPFDHDFYGALFFLIVMFTFLQLGGPRVGVAAVPFVLSFTSGVITYPMTSFVVELCVILGLIAAIAGGRMKGQPIPRAVTGVVITSLTIYLVWNIYVATYFNLGNIVTSNILNLILNPFSNGQGSAAIGGSSGYSSFYLFQLLSSNLNSEPYGLGLLLPAWFLFLYGAGAIVYVVQRLWRRQRDLPSWSLIAAMIVTGVLLLLLPGGAEWVRLLPFLGPFMAVALLYPFASKHKATGFVVLCSILVLSIPTAIAYYPEVGTVGAIWQWEVSAGTFVQLTAPSSTIYIGSGLTSITSPDLYNHLVYGLSGTVQTPSGALEIIESQIAEFQSYTTSGALLAISPLIFIHYAHLYGETSANLAVEAVQSHSDSLEIVYTNGYTTLYR